MLTPAHWTTPSGERLSALAYISPDAFEAQIAA